MQTTKKKYVAHYIGLPPELRLAAQREVVRRAERGEQRVSVASLLREAVERAPWATPRGSTH